LNKGLFFGFVGQLVLGHVFFAVSADGRAGQAATARDASQASPVQPRTATTQDYNERLEELLRMAEGSAASSETVDYRVGADDLLDVSVFEAPDLNRTVRVAARGDISLPLLGTIQAAGLTSRELEAVLEELLRRTYMKEPHVAVFLREMQSHPVSVLGAVNKPGVFQIRDAKTLVEVLSMAEGLAEDAGNIVIVMRNAGLAESTVSTGDILTPIAASEVQGKSSPVPSSVNGSDKRKILDVDLKSLLDSGDPRNNVLVYPGDVVKVPRAGIVYVVGGVKKPGGFTLKTNENISVLQVLALAEGLMPTSAKSRARIIRTDEVTGARNEIPLDLGKILAGKATDPLLHAKDIVFVPNSAGKSALYRGAETSIGIASGLIIYRW
jgi:polysaccharide export outer membrane protein